MNINLYVFPVKEHIIFIRRAGFSFFLDTCGKFIFRFNRCYWSEVLVLGYFLLWFCQNEPGKEEMEGGREETCECYLLLGTWYFILCHPLFLPSIFPTIKVFLVNQLFSSGGQSTGTSALASVFPMNIQDWFPLGLTGFISLQSKGLLRVFSNTTVQKHRFFGTQPSLWSCSHIHTWPWKNRSFD